VTTALAPLVACGRCGLANVLTEVTDLKDFLLPPTYAELIVSSWASRYRFMPVQIARS
jgi:hypothetical protein